MKMRNIVVAPKAGVIKSINIKENEMVPKNQLLIELE
jgi:biotin carboxyl carrier protein